MPVEPCDELIDNCSGDTGHGRGRDNQPVDGTGDGDTSPEGTVEGPNHPELRAERVGGAGARIDTVTVEVSGAAGSTDSEEVTVEVSRAR